MKHLHLFGLLIAGACTIQACQSPEQRGAAKDSTSAKTASSDSVGRGSQDNAASSNPGGANGGTGANNAGADGANTAAGHGSAGMGASNSGGDNQGNPTGAGSRPSAQSGTTDGSPDARANAKDGGHTGHTPDNVTNETKVDDTEATFMKTAAIGGLMEVDLGKIAQKSANPKVKAFAAQMVADHSKANAQLTALAVKSGIILPASYPPAERAHVEMMKKMTGADFDKHYIAMMVTDHSKTLALFKKGADSEDSGVRDFAKKTIPVISGHYEKAKAIQAGLK